MEMGGNLITSSITQPVFKCFPSISYISIFPSQEPLYWILSLFSLSLDVAFSLHGTVSFEVRKPFVFHDVPFSGFI